MTPKRFLHSEIWSAYWLEIRENLCIGLGCTSSYINYISLCFDFLQLLVLFCIEFFFFITEINIMYIVNQVRSTNILCTAFEEGKRLSVLHIL